MKVHSRAALAALAAVCVAAPAIAHGDEPAPAPAAGDSAPTPAPASAPTPTPTVAPTPTPAPTYIDVAYPVTRYYRTACPTSFDVWVNGRRFGKGISGLDRDGYCVFYGGIAMPPSVKPGTQVLLVATSPVAWPIITLATARHRPLF